MNYIWLILQPEAGCIKTASLEVETRFYPPIGCLFKPCKIKTNLEGQKLAGLIEQQTIYLNREEHDTGTDDE